MLAPNAIDVLFEAVFCEPKADERYPLAVLPKPNALEKVAAVAVLFKPNAELLPPDAAL
mgnify:CR=1 FL=1